LPEAGGAFTKRIMHVTLLAFAQAGDALGFRERVIECDALDSPRAILARIEPRLSMENLRVAVDEEYADWDRAIGEAREIALIPPVSGG
jgi:molybdopterin synthase sulfur carrier subunit